MPTTIGVGSSTAQSVEHRALGRLGDEARASAAGGRRRRARPGLGSRSDAGGGSMTGIGSVGIGSATGSPRVARTSSSRTASRRAASFSGSMDSARRASRYAPRSSPPVERDAGQPDDGDRVARVGRRDLLVELLRAVQLPERDGPLGLEQELDHDGAPGSTQRAGDGQQPLAGVDRRVGDGPRRAGRAGSRPRRGEGVRPNSAMRSSPSTARSCHRQDDAGRELRVDPRRGSRPARRRHAAGPSRRCRPRAAGTGRGARRVRSWR